MPPLVRVVALSSAARRAAFRHGGRVSRKEIGFTPGGHVGSGRPETSHR
jgi:hypothetical protein